MRIIQKIKGNLSNKYSWYLLLLIPIFVSMMVQFHKENDIFFLLKHGEYIINHGFPTTDFLSMHQNFHFVMQQWLSATIFYLFYELLGEYGFVLVVTIVNLLIITMLYKLCMLLSDGNDKLSILLTFITDLLLCFMYLNLRPQIFDYLLLIIVLYIMELFYKKKSNKILLWLPLISFLSINLHASTWFLLYLFMLPYIVSLCYEKVRNCKDKRIYQVLSMVVMMFLVGFLNPYGIDNIIYIFSSYGNKYINEIVLEMYPPLLSFNFNIYGFLTYFIIGCILAVYIDYKTGKLSIRYSLLLLGVTVLALSHTRNLSLYLIGAIPPLALYLKNILKVDDKEERNSLYKRHYQRVGGVLLIFLFTLSFFLTGSLHSDLEEGVNYLLKHNKKEDIVLYANYNNGSYLEFRGLKPYIDSRAEVFLKENNKQKNIMKEYYLLVNDWIDYKKFVNKYHFTHFILDKKESLYYHISNDKDYIRIYRDKEYEIYQKRE